MIKAWQKGALILGAELRSMGNRWRRADRHARRFRSLLLGIALLVFALLLAGSWRAFYYLHHGLVIAPELGPALEIRLIEMAHLLFFVMLFISSLSVSLSVLYLDPEIAFLRVAPVEPSIWLASRLILVLVRSSWFVIFSAAPILLGWSLAAFSPQMALLRFIAAMIVLTIYNIIPVMLGSSAAVSIARFIPARRAKVVLVIFGVVGLSLAIIGLRAMTPERLLKPKFDPSVGVTLTAIAAPASPWLPSGWAARASVNGDVFAFFAVICAALAAALLAALACRRFHAEGLERFLVERRTRRVPSRRDFAAWITSPLPRPIALVAVKDLRLFVRDPSQWSQLIILMALVVIYVFNFQQVRGEVASTWLRDTLSLVNLAMAGFVLVAVANRFVFAALSLEGRAIWLIRSSPFSMAHVLQAKALVAIVPLLVLAELITILANRALGVSPAFATASALSVILMSAAITALGVGLGALTPRFDLRDPAQIGMTPAGILFMGAGLIYVGLTVAFLAVALMARGRWLFLAIEPGPVAWILPPLLTLGLNALVMLIPWHLGLKRAESMELR